MKKEEKKYLNNKESITIDKLYIDPLKQYIDEECKMIGITGEYGTGKSSIIQGLKREIGGEVDFLILEITKFAESSSEEEIKKEIRKNITLQLIENIDEDNKSLNNVKRKLKHHPSNSIDKLTVLSIFFLIIFPIILNHMTHDNFLVKLISFICIFLFLFILLDFFEFLENMINNYNSFKLSKIEATHKKESYLDYDLETIMEIIKGIKREDKKLVIVIEDIDRYKSLEAIEEIYHISKALKKENVAFIVTLGYDIFNDAAHVSKFFDAQLDILPITNNTMIYEMMEEKFPDGTISTKLLTKISPKIKNMRVFNTVFNKFIELKKNYSRISDNVSIDDRNELLSIAYLQTIYPKIFQNNANSDNQFNKLIKDVFDKERYVEELVNERREDIKFQIEEYEKEIEKLKGKKGIEEKYFTDAKRAEIARTINDGAYLRVNGNSKYYYARDLVDEEKILFEEIIDLQNQHFENVLENYKEEYDKIINNDRTIIEIEEEIKKLKEEEKEITSKIDILMSKAEVELIRREDIIYKYVEEKINEFLKDNKVPEIIEKENSELFLMFLIENNFLTSNCFQKMAYYSGEDKVKLRQRIFINEFKNNNNISNELNENNFEYITKDFLGRFVPRDFYNENFLNYKTFYILSINLNEDDYKEKINEIFKMLKNDEFPSKSQGILNNIELLFEDLYKYYYNQELEEKEEDKKYDTLNKIVENFLKNIGIENVTYIYKLVDIYKLIDDKSNLMIEILYLYYCKNFKEEDKFDNELFTILEKELGNDQIFKRARSKFIEKFKTDIKDKKVSLNNKIKNLKMFEKNVKKVDGYVKPYKIFNDNMFEINKHNIEYMAEDHIDKIKDTESIWRYISSRHIDEKANLPEEKLKKILTEILIKNKKLGYMNAYNRCVDYYIGIISKYEIYLEDISTIEDEFIESLVVDHNLYIKNEINFNYLIENEKYKELINQFSLKEEFIEKKKINEIISEITLSDINIDKVELLIKDDEYDIKDEIKKELKYKDALYSILEDEKINVDDKKEVLERNTGIIGLDKDKPINVNALIIVSNYDSEEQESYLEKLDTEEKKLLRKNILCLDKKIFMKYYSPSYQEFKDYKLESIINDEYDLEEKIKHVVNMRNIEENIKEVLEKLDMYQDFKFREKGRGSKSKMINNVYLENEKFMNILIDGGIIRKKDSDKIYR